jgi:exodeoxyribonuclease VII small subunit
MPKTPSPASAAAPAASYEEALAELERLIGQLESGQLPLDKLLESYQRGRNCWSIAAAAWRRSRPR